jgi:predicted amidohydrolase YtcJ
MVGFGMQLRMVAADAKSAPDVDAIVRALAARAAETPAGEWVKGAKYDQNKLTPPQHPTRHDLDRASRDHPIFLRHTSGHMAVVNSRALEVLGIDAATPDPEGGEIVRDEAGEPTGLLLEKAMHIATAAFYPHPVDEIVDALATASDVYLREGITSHTEAGIGYLSDLEAAAYRRAVDTGRLRVRSTLMVRAESLQTLRGASGEEALALDLGIATGWGDDMLRLGPVKMFSDGSLIGQTAAMRDGYEGDPDNHGLFATPRETLRDWILRSTAAAGSAPCTPSATRRSTSSSTATKRRSVTARAPITATASSTADWCRRRPSNRIARLGVIPVPQQRFIGELGDGFIRVLGRERVRWCYPQRSYLDRGSPMPGSSDRFVVQGAPLLGIHDAVNQRTDSGAPYVPEEAITPAQAIRAFTLNSAFASFDEHRKGSITPGKLADLVVLGQDPTASTRPASATWRSSRRWSAGRSCTGRCERRPNRRAQGRRSMTMPSSTSMSATSSVSPVG